MINQFLKNTETPIQVLCIETKPRYVYYGLNLVLTNTLFVFNPKNMYCYVRQELNPNYTSRERGDNLELCWRLNIFPHENDMYNVLCEIEPLLQKIAKEFETDDNNKGILTENINYNIFIIGQMFDDNVLLSNYYERWYPEEYFHVELDNLYKISDLKHLIRFIDSIEIEDSVVILGDYRAFFLETYKEIVSNKDDD